MQAKHESETENRKNEKTKKERQDIDNSLNNPYKMEFFYMYAHICAQL